MYFLLAHFYFNKYKILQQETKILKIHGEKNEAKYFSPKGNITTKYIKYKPQNTESNVNLLEYLVDSVLIHPQNIEKQFH